MFGHGRRQFEPGDTAMRWCAEAGRQRDARAAFGFCGAAGRARVRCPGRNNPSRP